MLLGRERPRKQGPLNVKWEEAVSLPLVTHRPFGGVRDTVDRKLYCPFTERDDETLGSSSHLGTGSDNH